MREKINFTYSPYTIQLHLMLLKLLTNNYLSREQVRKIVYFHLESVYSDIADDIEYNLSQVDQAIGINSVDLTISKALATENWQTSDFLDSAYLIRFTNQDNYDRTSLITFIKTLISRGQYYQYPGRYLSYDHIVMNKTREVELIMCYLKTKETNDLSLNNIYYPINDDSIIQYHVIDIDSYSFVSFSEKPNNMLTPQAYLLSDNDTAQTCKYLLLAMSIYDNQNGYHIFSYYDDGNTTNLSIHFKEILFNNKHQAQFEPGDALSRYADFITNKYIDCFYKGIQFYYHVFGHVVTEQPSKVDPCEYFKKEFPDHYDQIIQSVKTKFDKDQFKRNSHTNFVQYHNVFIRLKMRKLLGDIQCQQIQQIFSNYFADDGQLARLNGQIAIEITEKISISYHTVVKEEDHNYDVTLTVSGPSHADKCKTAQFEYCYDITHNALPDAITLGSSSEELNLIRLVLARFNTVKMESLTDICVMKYMLTRGVYHLGFSIFNAPSCVPEAVTVKLRVKADGVDVTNEVENQIHDLELKFSPHCFTSNNLGVLHPVILSENVPESFGAYDTLDAMARYLMSVEESDLQSDQKNQIKTEFIKEVIDEINVQSSR